MDIKRHFKKPEKAVVRVDSEADQEIITHLSNRRWLIEGIHKVLNPRDLPFEVTIKNTEAAAIGQIATGYVRYPNLNQLTEDQTAYYQQVIDMVNEYFGAETERPAFSDD